MMEARKLPIGCRPVVDNQTTAYDGRKETSVAHPIFDTMDVDGLASAAFPHFELYLLAASFEVGCASF